MPTRTQQALADALLHQDGPAAVDRAAALFRESLRFFGERRFARLVAVCLAGLGRVAARQERLERGALLCGAVGALCDANHLLLPAADQRAYERDLIDLRARLPRPAFDAAWRAGREVPLDQVVAQELPGPPAA